MPPAQSLRLIERLIRRRPRARRAPEPADMGTCFGMEQWLDERASMPASAAPSAAESGAPLAGAMPAARSWLLRWPRPRSA